MEPEDVVEASTHTTPTPHYPYGTHIYHVSYIKIHIFWHICRLSHIWQNIWFSIYKPYIIHIRQHIRYIWKIYEIGTFHICQHICTICATYMAHTCLDICCINVKNDVYKTLIGDVVVHLKPQKFTVLSHL